MTQVTHKTSALCQYAWRRVSKDWKLYRCHCETLTPPVFPATIVQKVPKLGESALLSHFFWNSVAFFFSFFKILRKVILFSKRDLTMGQQSSTAKFLSVLHYLYLLCSICICFAVSVSVLQYLYLFCSICICFAVSVSVLQYL